MTIRTTCLRWGFVGPERTGGPVFGSRLTVTFQEDPVGSTLVTLVHEQLGELAEAMPAVAENVGPGWDSTLGKLAAALLMLGARLGDRYGHRRTILVSLAVFAAGAAVAATAPSVLALAAGRCLQGAAAAASVPSALRLLTTLTAEGPARHRAIAAWSAAGAAAGASGFVVGGIVTDLASWRFIFWAYLPLAAALAGVIAATVPPDGGRRQAESLNLAGSALFTAAVMAFVVGTTLITQRAGHLAGGLLLGACLALAGGFALVDRRAAAPPRRCCRRS